MGKTHLVDPMSAFSEWNIEFARLGVANNGIEYVARSGDPTYAATCAEVQLHGAVQGILGEVHPLVLAAFDLPTGPASTWLTWQSHRWSGRAGGCSP
jgi:phenylalanyl-tRNA synthetase beta subunit